MERQPDGVDRVPHSEEGDDHLALAAALRPEPGDPGAVGRPQEELGQGGLRTLSFSVPTPSS
jgi:hypothetical protein